MPPGDNKISAIGKDLIETQCLGEFIGVAKLSKDFNRLFSDSLKKLIDAGGKNDYFEAAIQPILGKIDVNYYQLVTYLLKGRASSLNTIYAKDAFNLKLKDT